MRLLGRAGGGSSKRIASVVQAPTDEAPGDEAATLTGSALGFKEVGQGVRDGAPEGRRKVAGGLRQGGCRDGLHGA